MRQIHATVRTEKTAPVHRASFWKGVLRNYLFGRGWVLKFLGNKRKKATSKKSLFRPPFQKDTVWTGTVFFSLNLGRLLKGNTSIPVIKGTQPGQPGILLKRNLSCPSLLAAPNNSHSLE